MALANQLLQERPVNIAAMAERVGHSPARTFSTAFIHHIGLPPGRYARTQSDIATRPGDRVRQEQRTPAAARGRHSGRRAGFM
ncbi:MAG: hypothetical protein ACREPL_03160 [Rhodanobacteraceae bacterium]